MILISFSANTSEMEAAILQSELVKAAQQLNEEENSIDPLQSFKEMNYSSNAATNLIAKVFQFISRKVLGILFPGGVIYHSGQFEVLSRALKSGTPLIFVNLGKLFTSSSDVCNGWYVY